MPQDVRSHPWFSNFDFEKLLAKSVVPPYVPPLSDPFDTSNFDDYGDQDEDDVYQSNGVNSDDEWEGW